MKIIDRKAFLAMPENTLFSKWEPCVFGDLTIKGESWDTDFLTMDIASAVKCFDSVDFGDRCEHAALTGDSIAVDLDSMCRDGLFDEDQMFAVWEDRDVLALIDRLKGCVHDTP